MSRHLFKLSTFTSFLLTVSVLPAYAATPIDLSDQPVTYLQKRLNPKTSFAGTANQLQLQTTNEETDFNQTVHIRMQQSFNGYPVLGGDVIVHNPKGHHNSLHGLLASQEATTASMDGIIYEDLQNDLRNAPAYVFSDAQAEAALTTAMNDLQVTAGTKPVIAYSKKKLMVYVDQQNKAHWVYEVRMTAHVAGRLQSPIYFIDAINLSIHDHWDNLKTAKIAVKAGGFGGNYRNKLTYDSLTGNLVAFDIMRDDETQLCYLENDLVTVTDARNQQIASFTCKTPDAEHNHFYFSGNFDEFNGGYSPNNDAIYAAKVINDMYLDWYRIPVLSKDKKPMHLNMITHVPDPDLPPTDEYSPYWVNAAWEDNTETMYFGDGNQDIFPLTSLGVTAHEVSHGFTSQHSNLLYTKQSGGMNEAFSDMADQAAKYYTTGKNDYLIGPELVKNGERPFRYMKQPSKDGRSIDHFSQYHDELNVHLSSGIYNRAFYLLASSKGWNAKKAFDVMVQANRFYWTSNSTFSKGACGVVKATKDYNYDVKAVMVAFRKVGVKANRC